MGIKNYFKVTQKEVKHDVEDEKTAAAARAPSRTEQPRQLLSGAASSRSYASSGIIADETKQQLMLSFLYQQQQALMWIQDMSGRVEGTMIRVGRNNYIFSPPQLASSPLAQVMHILNVQAAMTINSNIIKRFIGRCPEAVDLPLSNELRVQIVPEIDDLCRARKHQYAAFIASEGILLVWEDDRLQLLERARTIEAELVRFLWNMTTEVDAETPLMSDLANLGDDEYDEETGEMSKKNRPIMYLNSVMVALTLFVLMALLGLGYQNIVEEILVTQSWMSLIFLAMTPITRC